MPSIVTVNVTQTVAPTPSTLQQTGALISQGGTNTVQGTVSFLTQAADLTTLLAAPIALTNIVWSGTIATATCVGPHGFAIGDTLNLDIAGALPSGYNGSYTCTIVNTTQFTYPLATNPGTETTPGTYVPSSVSVITQMTTTFFAQGSSLGVYVLELGPGNATDGATYLGSWIQNNPAFFYSYLVPRIWDGNTAFLDLLESFQSTTSRTYFFVTTTPSTYANYTAQMKCVFALVEATQAQGKPATEFSCAAPFYVTLNYSPSSTNKVTPLGQSFVFGVTPYPQRQNGVLLNALKAAGINYIATGAEGGISITTLVWGLMPDLNPFNYWYSIDWVQINIDLNISNAVINGSNNPINPLYLNQGGINTLQSVGAQTISSAITFGLALGPVVQTEFTGQQFGAALSAGTYAGQAVINAVPFSAYFISNPGDYKLGRYAGFSVTYTPQIGFLQIVFDVNVTQFVG